MSYTTVNISNFNQEILEHILTLNRDLEQELYKIYSIRLSTARDESDTPISILELTIEDLDNRTTLELKSSLEHILNADKNGIVRTTLKEDNFYDIQYTFI